MPICFEPPGALLVDLSSIKIRWCEPWNQCGTLHKTALERRVITLPRSIQIPGIKHNLKHVWTYTVHSAIINRPLKVLNKAQFFYFCGLVAALIQGWGSTGGVTQWRHWRNILVPQRTFQFLKEKKFSCSDAHLIWNLFVFSIIKNLSCIGFVIYKKMFMDFKGSIVMPIILSVCFFGNQFYKLRYVLVKRWSLNQFAILHK